ncbi:DUF6105 family protein, partial [Sinorhizobium sp. 6-117]
VVDSAIVFALVGLRKRRQIASWYRRRFGARAAQSREAFASDANLSSAP